MKDLQEINGVKADSTFTLETEQLKKCNIETSQFLLRLLELQNARSVHAADGLKRWSLLYVYGEIYYPECTLMDAGHQLSLTRQKQQPFVSGLRVQQWFRLSGSPTCWAVTDVFPR